MNMDPNSLECIILNKLYKLRKFMFEGICLKQGITHIPIGLVHCIFTATGVSIFVEEKFDPSTAYLFQFEDLNSFEMGVLSFFNGLEIKIEELE